MERIREVGLPRARSPIRSFFDIANQMALQQEDLDTIDAEGCVILAAFGISFSAFTVK